MPARNGPLELILQLLGDSRLPMEASDGLTRHLGQYADTQLSGAGRPNDLTNVLDPYNLVRAIEPEDIPENPVSISKDPWFDELMAQVESYKPAVRPQAEGELFVWVTHRDGRRSRIDGPFDNSEDAMKSLKLLQQHNFKNLTLSIGPNDRSPR